MAKAKPYKGIAMEGAIAQWYAKNTAKAQPEFRALAERLAAQLQPNSLVLEIAPGPGYLAIELARLHPLTIAGLDVSHALVRIARTNAERAGVTVDFRHGNASSMPFADEAFDLIVCRAAFKNFSDPIGAMREMHRVLKPGGRAVIIDMRCDASDGAVAAEVGKMGLGSIDAFITRFTLRMLRMRAYSREDFLQMAATTPFGGCEILESPMGFEVTLRKHSIH